MPEVTSQSHPIDETHLELVQGVINRLAGNSFVLKGWSVTLVAAVLALNVKEAHVLMVAIGLLPALTFWGLDGYFLAQERLFRDLYNALIDPDVPPEARPARFSMRTEALTFGRWARATLWGTLLTFHGPVVAVILAVLLYMGIAGAALTP